MKEKAELQYICSRFKAGSWIAAGINVLGLVLFPTPSMAIFTVACFFVEREVFVTARNCQTYVDTHSSVPSNKKDAIKMLSQSTFMMSTFLDLIDEKHF